MKWLDRNYRRKDFFLWIDTFDPHEPWDPPQYYIDMYDPGYKGRVFEAPTYGLRRKMGITDRELKQIRARYAGEVTMVDTWFGHLLTKIERLGIFDETVIMFTSDHGTAFDGPGDFGMIQKANVIGADGMCMSAGLPLKDPKQFFPMSLNIARIPLMIRLPGLRRSKRIKAIVQPWDITATVLDIFGIPCPGRLIGRSVLPLIAGKGKVGRDAAISGTNQLAQAMTERWTYTVWRGEQPACLFDLRNDPACRKNVVLKQRAVARMLHEKIVAFMRQQGIKEEFIAGYKT
jgi:arylsulfatase A-like enzyme